MPVNLLQIGAPIDGNETFEDLLSRPGLRIERIVSRGHGTPADRPYVQNWDEWVLVLHGQARLLMEGSIEHVL